MKVITHCRFKVPAHVLGILVICSNNGLRHQFVFMPIEYFYETIYLLNLNNNLPQNNAEFLKCHQSHYPLTFSKAHNTK